MPDLALRAAVYRSGLKLKGCLRLPDAIAANLDDIVPVLQAEQPDPTDHDHLLF